MLQSQDKQPKKWLALKIMAQQWEGMGGGLLPFIISLVYDLGCSQCASTALIRDVLFIVKAKQRR